MRRIIYKLAAPLIFAAPAAGVCADIYKCVDEAGHVTYSSMSGRGCRKMDIEAPAPSAVPARQTPAKTASPNGFPKVDAVTQKARDEDRRRILESELAAETKNLELARKELAEQEAVRYGHERNYQKVLERLKPYQDKVQLHERNVEALQRELSKLK